MALFIGPVLYSANLYAVAEKLSKSVQHDAAASSSKCGKLTVPNMCDPVCDSIFSTIKDPKKAAEMVTQMLSCDSVCQCICSPICDGIV